MRRKSLRRQLRGRWKFVGVWTLLLLLAGVQWFRSWCGPNLAECEARVEELVFALKIILIIFATAFVLWIPFFVSNVKKQREELKLPGFKNRPWEFDHQTIEFIAHIEHVLKIRTSYRIKLWATDKWRTFLGNEDKSGRYVHQSILVSSPLLRSGERLKVNHNIRYGKVAVARGDWVKIRGEYVHHRARLRSKFFKRMTYYGFVHFTHEPRGFIEVLDGKPEIGAGDEVEVVEGGGKGEV